MGCIIMGDVYVFCKRRGFAMGIYCATAGVAVWDGVSRIHE